MLKKINKYKWWAAGGAAVAGAGYLLKPEPEKEKGWTWGGLAALTIAVPVIGIPLIALGGLVAATAGAGATSAAALGPVAQFLFI